MKTFNIKKTAAVALTALGLLSANAQAKVQKPMELSAMSYSFALNGQAELNINTHNVQTTSDEYWLTVSADELKKGVDVHTSVSGALIKISRGGEQYRPLNAQSLQLFSTHDYSKNLAGKIIGEEDLNATGVFKNATAIKMDKAIAPGKFQLKYDGPLAKDGQFVIHVKEKHSLNKLLLSTQKQHVLKGEALDFNALLQQGDKTLALDSVSAYVISPSGVKFNIPSSKSADGTAKVRASEFINNLNVIESPVNGLYELYINTVANDKGKQILRTGKIAFALAEQTAKLEKRLAQPINSLKANAVLPINVIEPGRYEVRAILYGHDTNGNLKPIMETHSAKNLESGKGVINMTFDKKLLIKSDLAAPYVLKHVRLFDQTRMSRL